MPPQLLFSSGPKLLKDSDPDRGGCWALVRKASATAAPSPPHLTRPMRCAGHPVPGSSVLLGVSLTSDELQCCYLVASIAHPHNVPL